MVAGDEVALSGWVVVMSAELAEEHRQLQELVAKFVERELMPLGGLAIL